MPKVSKQTYYSNTKVVCANCSSEYIIGMTMENPQVEICGNCHPFYTGKEVLVDTAGRIEKFQARASKAAGAVAKAKKLKARKSKQSLADLSE